MRRPGTLSQRGGSRCKSPAPSGSCISFASRVHVSRRAATGLTDPEDEGEEGEGNRGGGQAVPPVPRRCFISGLMAQRFMLHIYAALAEKERALVADLTRATLAQKKAKGTILGNWTNLPDAQAKGVATNRKAADAFAANVLPIIRQIQVAGATTHRALAPGGKGPRSLRCEQCSRPDPLRTPETIGWLKGELQPPK